MGETAAFVVASLDEWKALPEIAVAAIKNERRQGTVYTFHKVGFFAIAVSDCRTIDTSGAILAAGKYVFPTAVVEFNDEKVLCRLPLQLSNWAFDAVALTRQLRNHFPMRIELGILRGRHYAEIL